MTERILCVDDDPLVLQGYQRALRGKFRIESALGGEEGTAALAERGPYAVVVADMRMPGMNGVEFLARAKELAPNTVRMMLTGNADQQTALEAVNQGHIFRFLTKPCPADVFAKALEAGIAQYRLVTAERDLLGNTLRGAIRVLTDILGLVNPTAFGRASRVRAVVSQICRQLDTDKGWLYEIAAMLCQIGCVAVPEEVLTKAFQGEALSENDRQTFGSHPELGRSLVAQIPRLEEVAEIVACQDALYEVGPTDRPFGEEIPLGSRILKVALDWDTLVSAGMAEELALAELNDREGWYDPRILEAMRTAVRVRVAHTVERVRVHELADDMILADDVRSLSGMLLGARGQEVTAAMRARLRNYAANVGIRGPIKVFAPITPAQRTPSSGE